MFNDASRQQVERFFEKWGSFVHRRRWLVIVSTLGLSGLLIAQVPQIRIDTSAEGLLRADDPILLAYRDFRAQFGRDDMVIVAIRPPRVLDAGFLERLREIHEALESEVPYLEDVTSLINARNTRGDEDSLTVDGLLDEWPTDDGAWSDVSARVRTNPLYRHILLSADERYTAIIIELESYARTGDEGTRDDFEFEDTAAPTVAELVSREFLTGVEIREALAAVRVVLDRYGGPDLEIHVVGGPVMANQLSIHLVRGLGISLGLALLSALAVLLVLFRTVVATLVPLLVIMLALAATLGLMPLLDMPLQLVTQLLPPLFLAIGVGTSVHLISVFYQCREQAPDDVSALRDALAHSGPPIVMTGLTTAGALASFAVAELRPVANIGILAPAGVLLMLVFCLTLLPASLCIASRSGPASAGPRLEGLERLLIRVGGASGRHAMATLTVCVVLLAVSLAGATRLRFSYYPGDWFKPGEPVRESTELVNRELRGVTTLEILLDSGRENGLHEPEVLAAIEALEQFNEGLVEGPVFVGKTTSYADVLREIHGALDAVASGGDPLPRDRILTAQELLLFENSGSEDLEALVDSQFRFARITLKMPWRDAFHYLPLIERIRSGYAELLPEGVTIEVTGRLLLMTRTFAAVITSMASSYAISFVVITFLMIVMLGSVRLGLVSMLPNLFPVIVTLGVMGWLDIPLDFFTLLVGSIVIGLAVDDTLHFLHGFRRYYARSGDHELAIEETLRTTGRALFFSTVILCICFLNFAFGTMQAVVQFGVLTGFALAVAFVADVTLSPALMTLVSLRRERKLASTAG